ncbi:aminotransferase class V-fold PLP-dependent enzyme [candidate division KSB1 bacterium]|nr:aminotransferase class V-fold PLP-dependent enzyme [candidate division KSB1 bacterium]
MDSKSFRENAHRVVDWMADYLENVEKFPVKSQVAPREIFDRLPAEAPQEGESFDTIMEDFTTLIVPGITHWQSPKFFAYFPANSSYPSVLAEMLTSTLAAQCMIWDTSPAAAELEEKVLNWLKTMLGLPQSWNGAIQDSASSATLVAVLTAREKYSLYNINEHGFKGHDNYRIYCSTETHSSVEKAVKIAGLGRSNLVKIDVDHQLAMVPEKLKEAIERDIDEGNRPICVVAALGTTGTVAVDPLHELADICHKYNVWLHVDAAYAGSALILPEYRWMIDGIDSVDSFVFNPHKWLFTNFDCSAYFVRDKEALLQTFEILPEYLKTASRGQVNDYRDWGVQLGRRFRALKLWFVIREYGVKGLQATLKHHIHIAREMENAVLEHPDFELMTQRMLNVICFRYHPRECNDIDFLNKMNEKILQRVNKSGKAFLTHTKVRGQYTIRMVIGQTRVEKRHVTETWELLQETAQQVGDVLL